MKINHKNIEKNIRYEIIKDIKNKQYSATYIGMKNKLFRDNTHEIHVKLNNIRSSMYIDIKSTQLNINVNNKASIKEYDMV